MNPKKPQAALEVLFEGGGILPERIPLVTLSNSLSAIQRLASGPETTEKEQEQGDEESLRLLEVKRGSAVFRIFVPSPKSALGRLRHLGRILQDPEEVGENDYVLGPIERLSTAARSLGCSIAIKEARAGHETLARIESTSYQAMSQTLLVRGETAIAGRVLRVGGATQNKCGLRVSFQDRMLICRVPDKKVARKLGQHLYQNVAVYGIATWIKSTWRIFSLEITEVRIPSNRKGKAGDVFDILREAGGKDWDRINDPEAFLREMSGDR